MITAAMDEFWRLTCIKWLPKDVADADETITHDNYVAIRNGRYIRTD